MSASVSEFAVHQRIQAHHSAAQAALLRRLGDVQLAEDAMQEAALRALQRWTQDGIPEHPVAWLVTVGMNSFRDRYRKESRLKALPIDTDFMSEAQSDAEQGDFEDDVLRLIFLCCHPAIASENQLALTLRMVMGFGMNEIASALLVPVKTLEKRIARAKRKIAAAGIDFELPPPARLAVRLNPVQQVLYLIFNEGYYGSSGRLLDSQLCRQAIILCRSLCRLYPEPENFGLLALMLFNDSRSAARLNARQELVTLDRQDRGLWKRGQIQEADVLLQKALRKKQPGFYQLQAAISGVHACAPSSAQTDWREIIVLYQHLLLIKESPVVRLNYAVALLYAGEEDKAARLLDELNGELAAYSPYHAARAKLYEKRQDMGAMQAALRKASELSGSSEVAAHYRTQL